MAETIEPPLTPEVAERIRAEWVARLAGLYEQVEAWCRAHDWATRRIERKLDDHEIGAHRVPVLLMQEGITKLILEPIGRMAFGGADGIVDMYRMPAYDNVATLFHESGHWAVRYPLPGDPIARRGEPVVLKPLTDETLGSILVDMVRDDS